MGADTNSRRTRVLPVFTWMETNGGSMWPRRLLELAEGIKESFEPGDLLAMHCAEECQVAPSAARLMWMLRNVELLAPQDGRKWLEIRRRMENPEKVEAVLQILSDGKQKPLPKSLAALVLEGPSHADCLIECERALIWIEGKRFDWLSPSTTWDVTRDQLARNLEAVWMLANAKGKEYCLLICHEHPLKHHEKLLIGGYRNGTWSGGWPHLEQSQRQEFSKRIGTLTWQTIADSWPAISALPELADLA
jgi:hypothetical protein